MLRAYRLLFLGGLVGAMGGALISQATPGIQAPSIAFDAATIKLVSDASAPDADRRELIANGRLHLGSYPLSALVAAAYGISSQLMVWPTGRSREHFTVDGVAPPSEPPANPAMLRAMLKTLLIDRLGFQADWEDRSVTAFVLRKWKDGPHPSATPADPDKHSRAGDPQTMGQILNRLQISLGPIADETGLEGSFDFDIRLTGAWCAAAVPRPDRAPVPEEQLTPECMAMPTVRSVLRGAGFDIDVEKTRLRVLVVKDWKLPDSDR